MSTMAKQSTKNVRGPSAGKTPGGVEALRQELKGLIKTIDAQGLGFLINQAHTLLHNQQVEKVNRELHQLQAIDQKARKSGRSSFSAATLSVDIEEGDGHFIVVLNNSRKFLTLKEMRSLLRICQAAESGSEAAPRLHRWFAKNRTDILTDARLAGPADPMLAEVYTTITARYKTKE